MQLNRSALAANSKILFEKTNYDGVQLCAVVGEQNVTFLSIN